MLVSNIFDNFLIYHIFLKKFEKLHIEAWLSCGQLMPEFGCLFWSIRLLLSGGGKDNQTQAWVITMHQNILCDKYPISVKFNSQHLIFQSIYFNVKS